MFSGIVEALGTIHALEASGSCLKITITPQKAFSDLNIGDSVAVNGVCLTVTDLFKEHFSATVVPETLRLTNLEQLSVSSIVNLERALKSDARIGGHYVQGHVDAVTEVLEIQAEGEQALLLKISLPSHLAKYVVNKGYLALDGMSLTVIEAGPEWFTVTLIPHTQAVTISKHYRRSSKINLEVDILSKYVEKLLRVPSHETTH